MTTEYLECDLNWDNIECKSYEDELIDKAKSLAKKHNITFIESLEVIKHIEDKSYYLKDIKDALYEVDKSIMDLRNSICEELSNIRYDI